MHYRHRVGLYRLFHDIVVTLRLVSQSLADAQYLTPHKGEIIRQVSKETFWFPQSRQDLFHLVAWAKKAA